MKIDWRVSTIAAGSAFLLSVLVGVIGNVSFGVLILRAVVAGIIFGAGAVGILILVDRFIPELRSAATPPDATAGGSVDIVVEGDDDLPGPVGSEEGPPAEDGGALGPDEMEASTSAPEGSDGVLEEAEESDSDKAPVYSVADTEEVEEISSGDDLPSVEPMQGGFTEVPLGDEGLGDAPASGEDPELMARAIRTVLKREG